MSVIVLTTWIWGRHGRGPLSLGADEAEELDGPGSGGAEPVGDLGVELGDLARFEDEVVFTEEELELSVEYEHPVVPVVGSHDWMCIVGEWAKDEGLLGLNATDATDERDDRRAALVYDRSQVDSWVARRGVRRRDRRA